MDSLRIDKWLWAARFYKTRSLATEEVGKHRVQVNGQDVKPAREIKPGDTILLHAAAGGVGGAGGGGKGGSSDRFSSSKSACTTVGILGGAVRFSPA